MPSTERVPFDPVAYANKRKEQIERAKELRNARASKLAAPDAIGEMALLPKWHLNFLFSVLHAREYEGRSY